MRVVASIVNNNIYIAKPMFTWILYGVLSNSNSNLQTGNSNTRNIVEFKNKTIQIEFASLYVIAF